MLSAFIVCGVISAAQGAFRWRVSTLSAVFAGVWTSTFDTREMFIAICFRVTVLLTSCTLGDVFLVYPGSFYLDKLILKRRYTVYVFVIVGLFQVNEKQVEWLLCNSVMNVYNVTNCMSQLKQFLSDVFYVCGVMKVFEDFPVGSLFLKLVCVVIDTSFFEVLDKFAVCIRCCTTQFDDVISHTFGAILFIFGNFTYVFYHFTVVDYTMNKNGRRFVIWWRLRFFA
jgi:hypothetical protein